MHMKYKKQGRADIRRPSSFNLGSRFKYITCPVCNKICSKYAGVYYCDRCVPAAARRNAGEMLPSAAAAERVPAATPVDERVPVIMAPAAATAVVAPAPAVVASAPAVVASAPAVVAPAPEAVDPEAAPAVASPEIIPAAADPEAEAPKAIPAPKTGDDPYIPAETVGVRTELPAECDPAGVTGIALPEENLQSIQSLIENLTACPPPEEESALRESESDCLPSEEGLHGSGLLHFRKWWELRAVDISVNGSMLFGIPVFAEKNTLRVINDNYSYFIPLEKVDYVRTTDGLKSSFLPQKTF